MVTGEPICISKTEKKEKTNWRTFLGVRFISQKLYESRRLFLLLIICFPGNSKCRASVVIHTFSTFGQCSSKEILTGSPTNVSTGLENVRYGRKYRCWGRKMSKKDTRTSGKTAFCLFTKEVSRNGTPVCLVYPGRWRGLPPRARGHE